MWVTLLVTVGFGAIGWVDDYRKVVHRNPKGLSARVKFLWQSVIGLIAAIYLAFRFRTGQHAFHPVVLGVDRQRLQPSTAAQADLIVPFVKTISYPLGVWGFIALTYCVIVGTSNAAST